MNDSLRNIFHYSATIAIVLITFGVQTLLSRCYPRCCSGFARPSSGSLLSSSGNHHNGDHKKWRKLDIRLLVSAVVCFVLTTIKQVGDALQLQWLPWCSLFNGGCHFDWLDLFLTIDGILTGVLLIIGGHVITHRFYRDASMSSFPPDDPTEAMTVDMNDYNGGSGDQDDDDDDDGDDDRGTTDDLDRLSQLECASDQAIGQRTVIEFDEEDLETTTTAAATATRTTTIELQVAYDVISV